MFYDTLLCSATYNQKLNRMIESMGRSLSRGMKDLLNLTWWNDFLLDSISAAPQLSNRS